MKISIIKICTVGLEVFIGGAYMRRFGEKFLIIMFCMYNTYEIFPEENLVFYFLITLIISSLLDLVSSKKVKATCYTLFGIMCLSYNLFVFYLPLILYNLYLDFNIYFLIAAPLIFIKFSFTNILVSVFSIYIAITTEKHSKILKENRIARDKAREDALYLKKYNDQLKIDKEKNIHIAILTERNRIAKEMHDSIGHAITSSILQVESLKIISTENNIKEKLDIIQNTLTNGMDEIRKSIHNLYNESLDLKEQIEKLCTDVPNIDIILVYRIEDNLSYEMKFDILSVIKEGITNCVKHSNATNLKISLIEQPKFYSIIVKDNGTKFDESSINTNKGMGLISIKEIADKYNGFLNYNFDDGFKIHLTLMKG